MRAVVQRVSRASVTVDRTVVGAIDHGLMALVATGHGDTDRDIDYIKDKLLNLRIFEDDDGKMNRSVQDIGGSLLLVSQFTLYGDARKGRRPSFVAAMPPQEAEGVFQRFLRSFDGCGVPVASGVFRAMMEVELVNDGPVTILLDSRKEF